MRLTNRKREAEKLAMKATLCSSSALCPMPHGDPGCGTSTLRSRLFDMAKATSPTSAQLRHGIASGQSGDKISNIDPAAAPLGTDDEAGGNPPTQQQLALAATHELQKKPKPPLQMEWGPIAVMVGSAALLVALTWICLKILP